MRHSGWTRWRSGRGRASGESQSVARKLLGALRNRLTLGAASTGADRRVLDDGTLVEVAWHGDQPVVRITPPGDGGDVNPPLACELYVESGLLDLGPNIAPDAAARFGRGFPTFNDDPATLHFGNAIDCSPFGGINGIVQVALQGGAVGLRGTCFGGDPRASRTHSAAKKQAQAVLPASMWTGLARRYVSAIYGGTLVDYALTGFNLLVGESSVLSPWSGEVTGLIEIDGRLLFVRAGLGSVTFHSAIFDPCAEHVFRFWRAMGRNTDSARKRAERVLSVALSGCLPGPQIESVAISVPGVPVTGYGFAFDDRQPRATIVTVDSGQAVRTELVFSINGAGTPQVAAGEIERVNLPGIGAAAEIAAPAAVWSESTRAFAAGNSGGLSFDAPLAAWYEDGERAVVRHVIEIATTPAMPELTHECFDRDSQNRTSPAIPPFDVCPTESNVDLSTKTAIRVRRVTTGIHLDVGASTRWSTVRSFVSLFPEGLDGQPLSRISRVELDAIDGGVLAESLLTTVSVGSPGINLIFPNGIVECQVDLAPRFPLLGELPVLGPCTIASPVMTGTSSRSLDCCPPGTDTVAAVGGAITTTNKERNMLHRAVSLAADSGALPQQILVVPWGGIDAAAALDYRVIGGEGDRAEQHAKRSALFESYTEANVSIECRNGIGTVQSTCLASDNQTTVGLWNSFRTGINGVAAGSPVRYNTADPAFPVVPTTPYQPGIFWEVRARWGDERRLAAGRSMLEATSSFSQLLEGASLSYVQFGSHSQLESLGGLLNIQPGDPVSIETPTGGSTLAERYFGSESILPGGFQHRAALACSGAAVHHVVNFIFGESVNGDRHESTDGYPVVQWPSFVGWA